MRRFGSITALCILVYASSAAAQQRSSAYESLPEDVKKRISYGERYDPQRYEQCMKDGRKRFGPRANFTDCEIYRLKRTPSPEYWPFSNVPRPKLSPAFQDTGYREGMTAKGYFEHLCRTEAGEFIYRTVDDVAGIYQIRPRRYASPDMIVDRFVMEDPYGYTNLEQRSVPAVFLGSGKYRYLETPVEGGIRVGSSRSNSYHSSMSSTPPPDKRYRLYRLVGTQYVQEFASQPKSRYGFTWREIHRPMDRELRIAGSELIVLDLFTGEILGIRRGFMWAPAARHASVSWEGGAYCPVLGNKPPQVRQEHNKGSAFSYWFISQVIKPAKE